MLGLSSNAFAGHDQAPSIGFPDSDSLAANSAHLKIVGYSARGLGNSETQFQCFSSAPGGRRGGNSTSTWILTPLCSTPCISTHLRRARLL